MTSTQQGIFVAMNRTFIDRFQYYRDSYVKARLQGDIDRQRLWEIYEVAHPHFDDNKPYAIDLLKQGAALSQNLRERCWELLFDFWQYEVDLNQPERLDMIIKLFVKANQPKYRECTLLGDIYASLLRAYLWYDPLGYEGEILDGIQYVLNNLPLPQDTFIIVLWTKMQLLLEMRDYDGVLKTSKTYFRYAENYNTHLAWGYTILLQTYYHQDDLVLALQAAGDLEQAAERAKNDSLVFTALKWQYTIYHRMGDSFSLNNVSRTMRQYDTKQLSGYDAMHDAEYEYDKHAFGWLGKLALIRSSEHRIEGAIKANRPYLECKTRLRRLAAFLSLPTWFRWLVHLLLPIPSVESQVADAQIAAEKLIKPEPMLERIEQVAAGKIKQL
ncbi:MAG: hypothetical protein Q9P44_08530 [Anaerolineae bacterium]|nr:hypothetical protein [Anaerolineae bacterium]